MMMQPDIEPLYADERAARRDADQRTKDTGVPHGTRAVPGGYEVVTLEYVSDAQRRQVRR